MNQPMPLAVRRALEHVRKFFPSVSRVRFSRDQRWLYTDADGHAPEFDIRIDVGILEEAADAVPFFPISYQRPTAEAEKGGEA